MKKYIHHDIVISIVLIIISLIFYVLSLGFPVEASIFPRVISLIIILTSIITLFREIKSSKEINEAISKNKDDIKKGITFNQIRKPLIAMLYLISYVIGIRIIGYFISTFIFLVLFMRFFKVDNYKVVILTSISVNLFIYILFVFLFQINLPTGILI